MVKAVILAAGLGTRLRELVADKPKCMVHVNGRPILGWQIDALNKVGVTEIAIVTGFHASVLHQYTAAAFPGQRFHFIHNEHYADTNNMYSLWLTRRFSDGHTLLFMNADVAFVPEILRRLIEAKRTAVAVDVGNYNEESMKVVQTSVGNLVAISKQITAGQALGSSIDVYVLQAADAKALYDECESIIVRDGQRKQWSEVALHRLLECQRIDMRAVDVSGLGWYEIDNPADLMIAETLFTAIELKTQPPKVYFIDLDGTVYLGKSELMGSANFVEQVKRAGAQVVFLSNNSSKSHADYVARLAQSGITAMASEMLLSTDALGAHLRSEGITRAFIFGSSGMKKVLAGYGVSHTEQAPQAALLGFHTQLTYREMAAMALLLQNSALPYYASHLDRVCPTEGGPVPDAGALVELFALTTGRRPARVFGKPAPEFVLARIRALGVEPRECVIIGDRVYTDMALARAAGTRFVGVLSGEAKRRDFEGEAGIMIASSIGQIAEYWHEE